MPAPPTPRSATTCAGLLEAAGRPTGVRLATVQPTANIITARQAGDTVCAFTVDLPSGTTTATRQITAEIVGNSGALAMRCYQSDYRGRAGLLPGPSGRRCWSSAHHV